MGHWLTLACRDTGALQAVRDAVVVMKSAKFIEVSESGFCAESEEQGFFLVRGVPLPAHAKVVKRRLQGSRLIVCQASA